MKRLVCCALACFFCFFVPLVVAQTATPFVVKNEAIGTFSGLDIRNPVNVVIEAAPAISTPTLQILGDPKSVAATTWAVKNHILYLATKWNYWPRQGDRLTIKVNVSPSQLNQIRFTSNGCLIGKGLTGSLTLTTKGSGCIKLCANKLNLKSLTVDGKTSIMLYDIDSTNLVVQGRNNGKIKIEGDVALQSIRVAGNGSLMVYWVDTPCLKISAMDTEKIVLAGVVRNLDVQLTGKTCLLAKQLQVENGFVETQNQAQAEITVRDRLNALAKDRSVIYYSPNVDFISSYTESSGLVLSN
jgi:hypothetical protein